MCSSTWMVHGLRPDPSSTQGDGNADLAGSAVGGHELGAEDASAVDATSRGRGHTNGVLAVADRFLARNGRRIVRADVRRHGVEAGHLDGAGIVGAGRRGASLDRLSRCSLA